MARKMRKFASAGSIGRKASENVSKALAGISADTKPDMKDDTIKTATAPQKARSFSEAFKAARAAGVKTFEWEGKPGTTFTTKMAGEGASKPSPKASAPAAKAASTPAKKVTPPTKTATTTGPDITVTAPKPKQASTPAAPKKDYNTISRESRNKFLENINPFRWAARGIDAALTSGTGPSKPSAAPKPDVAKAARLAEIKKAAEAPGASGYAKSRYRDALASNMYKKGGKVMPTKKYAKGGSVDGCAVRGKTRAPMKKGK